MAKSGAKRCDAVVGLLAGCFELVWSKRHFSLFGRFWVVFYSKPHRFSYVFWGVEFCNLAGGLLSVCFLGVDMSEINQNSGCCKSASVQVVCGGVLASGVRKHTVFGYIEYSRIPFFYRYI